MELKFIMVYVLIAMKKVIYLKIRENKMKLIKFDGTAGIMSCEINDNGIKYCMAIREGIGDGFGKKVKNPKYKKGQSCDLKDFDVVFEFINPKSIDSMIKVLKQVKKEFK